MSKINLQELEDTLLEARDQQLKSPTVEERLEFYRDNAKCFVEAMRVMIDSLLIQGEDDMANKLKVWALMPWEAVLREDQSGDLWFTCEVCSLPIKNLDDDCSNDDGGHFHHSCLDKLMIA